MRESETVQPAPLTVQIQDAVASGELSLPPLPAVATRLMELLADEERADWRSVAALVHQDPAVAASLLRMANSAAYGGLRQITDLTQAIGRIGLGEVSSMVTALLLRGHFHTTNPGRQKLLRLLWDHSMAVALGAKGLATLTSGDPEESFLAGLFHDVGKLLVLKGVDHLQARQAGLEVTEPVMDELMDTLHARLGHTILSSWKIPAPICEAVLHHHDEDESISNPLVLRVQAADAMACKLGAHLRPDPELNLMAEPSVSGMELSDVELAGLLVDLEDELGAVQSVDGGAGHTTTASQAGV